MDRNLLLMALVLVVGVALFGCQGQQPTFEPSPRGVKSNSTAAMEAQIASLEAQLASQAQKEEVRTVAQVQRELTPDLTTAVQYCNPDDSRSSMTMSRAFNWPVVHSCSQIDLRHYDRWVLVGGHVSNPLYRMIFGESLLRRDSGFIVVRVDKSHVYEGRVREVWGVAGWTGNDTLQSAAYVVENGLPSRHVRIRH